MESARSTRVAPLALALALCASCSSTGSKEAEDPTIASVGRLRDMRVAEESQLVALPIGGYLQELDHRLRSWSRYRLEMRNLADLRKLESIQADIEHLVRLRFEDVAAELELGPPVNRTVAAMALGFSRRPMALSPLLTALSDPDDEVVGNALVGLGVLALADTPLAEICFLLGNHAEGWVRSNAAYAMQRVLEAGGGSDCVLESARTALIDTEPGARAQAAIALGFVDDGSAVKAIGDLLYDSTPLVVASAARALGAIGVRVAEQRGAVARLLATGLDRVPRQTRPLLLIELGALRGSSLGDEARPWRDWAFGLP